MGHKMDNTMWLLKGLLIGTSIFATGFILYLAIGTWRKPSQYSRPGDRGGEIASDFFTLLRHFFLQSPLFYAALVGALVIGCSLVVTP
ncbi:MAG: hypothetical protein WAN14_06220 [Candidatus Acidiferrales bacterium]